MSENLEGTITIPLQPYLDLVNGVKAMGDRPPQSRAEWMARDLVAAVQTLEPLYEQDVAARLQAVTAPLPDNALTEELAGVLSEHREWWSGSAYEHKGCTCDPLLPGEWGEMGWMERSAWYRTHVASVLAERVASIKAAARAEVEELRDSVEFLKSEAEHDRDNWNETRAQRDAARAHGDDLDALLLTAKKRLADMEAGRRHEHADLIALRVKCDKAEKRVTELLELIDGSQSEYERMSADLAAARKDADELRERVKRANALAEGWKHDGPDGAVQIFIERLSTALAGGDSDAE